mmetsp:Transcript_26422/g.61474  ORF Transcript_26422/g.61474 Transcript_26422/m.61474 type:complete len:247 (-) Transcript_26422:1054-1794(-)
MKGTKTSCSYERRETRIPFKYNTIHIHNNNKLPEMASTLPTYLPTYITRERRGPRIFGRRCVVPFFCHFHLQLFLCKEETSSPHRRGQWGAGLPQHTTDRPGPRREVACVQHGRKEDEQGEKPHTCIRRCQQTSSDTSQTNHAEALCANAILFTSFCHGNGSPKSAGTCSKCPMRCCPTQIASITQSTSGTIHATKGGATGRLHLPVLPHCVQPAVRIWESSMVFVANTAAGPGTGQHSISCRTSS